ncbi:8225_t:CDS:2 [Racocetra fulgida]|uniref:8225_t:CDS:1 n=1 Tax=Racocetra fulgida TaxID=60492 RepID=A0A9N8VWV2_9GLOM|nr:8225_t:CDS:2 [Racocetra fulgida]
MNPLRISYIRKKLSKHNNEELNKGQENKYETASSCDDQIPFKDLRILDIGCGGGVLSESLVRLGASVVGADASPENIQIARLHARKDPRLYSGPGALEYRCITAVPNGTHDFKYYLRPDELQHIIEQVPNNSNVGDLNSEVVGNHKEGDKSIQGGKFGKWGHVTDITGIGDTVRCKLSINRKKKLTNVRSTFIATSEVKN